MKFLLSTLERNTVQLTSVQLTSLFLIGPKMIKEWILQSKIKTIVIHLDTLEQISHLPIDLNVVWARI